MLCALAQQHVIMRSKRCDTATLITLDVIRNSAVAAASARSVLVAVVKREELRAPDVALHNNASNVKVINWRAHLPSAGNFNKHMAIIVHSKMGIDSAAMSCSVKPSLVFLRSQE